MKLLINTSVLLLLVLYLFSCSKFDQLNTDPVKPSTVTPEQLLLSAEKSAMDILYNSFVNNRIGMHYAQYWAASDKEEDSRYSLGEAGNSSLWSLYSRPLKDLQTLTDLNRGAAIQDPVPNQNAIAGILQVWLYQTLADAYGNIPYSSALSDSIPTPVYDDAAGMYADFLKRLNEYQGALDVSKESYGSGDVIYNGDVLKWKKLANSLILRIAMRMSKATPAEAKSAIETAAKNGVITTNADNALFPYTSQAPNQNPYNDFGREQVEFVVSETMVNFMQALNDPRLKLYARPAKNSKAILGKPYGLGTNSAADAQKYSTPGVRVYAPDFPGILMTASEVQFLLTEAAARGMNVGSPAAVSYEAGIRTSMDFWRVPEAAATTYINSVPYHSANWKNQVGSQKWIALYMQGLQSWYERLRLQFTKPDGTPLFIAPVAGSLDPNVTMVPSRLTYPVVETNTNNKNKEAAAAAIGGDTKGTKLWWQ
ncbi:SusD/RagB family nutrient-binding outer membrane lipoprotein [Niabella drilacis]|uniref:Starch-binding associating with outer membrane n=1 Tax=Niabella drilacis (strain DSM 25811 / CCM 8410 / CCUG 62505 / LMG 26954 / E90) TaxID=1285928 RepID=A0A1G6L611_NIADE|nr:SusD/RagB family nutrient-binding outer membrane lipoprotein [Niabella drilacis]SDC38581.1 Starch-binding associating with outer membrane [Niabella drilacis]